MIFSYPMAAAILAALAYRKLQALSAPSVHSRITSQVFPSSNALATGRPTCAIPTSFPSICAPTLNRSPRAGGWCRCISFTNSAALFCVTGTAFNFRTLHASPAHCSAMALAIPGNVFALRFGSLFECTLYLVYIAGSLFALVAPTQRPTGSTTFVGFSSGNPFSHRNVLFFHGSPNWYGSICCVYLGSPKHFICAGFLPQSFRSPPPETL